ncbi:MAG: hypothetical protein RLZ92_1904 [Pseudomonadota bacterium]|jgi:hypothetical protein
MKTITTLLSLFVVLAAGVAQADVTLQDNSKILGKWKVTAESMGLDKEKKALNVTWDFQSNGTLMTIGEDTLGRTAQMDIPIKYSVENGVIKKQVTPGREKYEDCSVLEMEGSNMILKCKGLFFFMTRK